MLQLRGYDPKNLRRISYDTGLKMRGKEKLEESSHLSIIVTVIVFIVAIKRKCARPGVTRDIASASGKRGDDSNLPSQAGNLCFQP